MSPTEASGISIGHDCQGEMLGAARPCHSLLPVGPSGKADDDDGADDDKIRRRAIFSSSAHLLLSLDCSSFFN
ncbi:hypothetical protein QR685DRAFT_573026 [Neurospora intermedia]|uniref:Uncharacterized protein n=1 Tax=Neurospora intermedia TaxID=5142 RepID=A0ABR3D7R2_NEUIN